MSKLITKIVQGGSFFSQTAFQKSKGFANTHSEAVGFRLLCKQKFL